jgi:hypothetical protein
MAYFLSAPIDASQGICTYSSLTPIPVHRRFGDGPARSQGHQEPGSELTGRAEDRAGVRCACPISLVDPMATEDNGKPSWSESWMDRQQTKPLTLPSPQGEGFAFGAAPFQTVAFGLIRKRSRRGADCQPKSVSLSACGKNGVRDE